MTRTCVDTRGLSPVGCHVQRESDSRLSFDHDKWREISTPGIDEKDGWTHGRRRKRREIRNSGVRTE